MAQVFIVIPVHNRIAHTLQCIKSLSIQTYTNLRVIVVDDGSTDGTAEQIRLQFPDAIVLSGDGNLWWTGATNMGVRYALEGAASNDYILTLNNDVVVPPDYLDAMVACAERNPRSLIGSVSLSHEDESTIADGGVRINWSSAKLTCLHEGEDYYRLMKRGPRLEKVNVLSGRGTLIPAEVFRSIGFFNEEQLPHYGADYEFSHRAMKYGYDLLVSYDSFVISNTKTTGMNVKVKPLGFVGTVKSFFSIRSPYSLKYRWRFSRLCCGSLRAPFYFALDVARLLAGTMLVSRREGVR